MVQRLAASILDLNSKKIIHLGAPTQNDDAARKLDVDTAKDFAISRLNHVGTQEASTISNFDAQVRTNRLDQLTAPNNPVYLNNQELTGGQDPTSPTSLATKNYVDQQIQSVTSGQWLKGEVVVAINTNVDLASPGATLDGVTLTVGQKVLLFGQTTGSQNGPYNFNGASVSMTRADNWDTQQETVIGSYWIVTQGTRADMFALMTNDSFTLGTDTMKLSFTPMTPSGGVPIEMDLGDGASTSFLVTHSFGTRAVNVVVWRNASPYDEITVAVTRPTVDTITVEPDDVWAASEFHVSVSKR